MNHFDGAVSSFGERFIAHLYDLKHRGTVITENSEPVIFCAILSASETLAVRYGVDTVRSDLSKRSRSSLQTEFSHPYTERV